MIKSLTKINLQGLSDSKANLQQEIAYSRSASEISFLHKKTIHFTDQTSVRPSTTANNLKTSHSRATVTV